MKNLTELLKESKSQKALDKLVDAFYECFDEYLGDKDYIEAYRDLLTDLFESLSEDTQIKVALQNVIKNYR